MSGNRCLIVTLVIVFIIACAAIAWAVYNYVEIQDLKDSKDKEEDRTGDGEHMNKQEDAPQEQEFVMIQSENPHGLLPAVYYDGVPDVVPGQKKCLIVVHEWWGMNEQIRKQGKDLADEGKYSSLVIDFYRGKVAIDMENALHYARGLDYAGAVQDINASAEYLMLRGCKKVGITGFCMGGALSLAAASELSNVTIFAAAPFYGIAPEQFDLTQIKCPVSMNFGTNDRAYPPVRYKLAYETMKNASVDVTLYEYEGAAHAFMNPTSNGYCESCSKIAKQRLFEFMDTHLQ